jgi:hypothetical protein
MYPLLISAATTIAGKVIDNWSAAKTAKAATTTENFAALLEKNSASTSSATAIRDSQIATLRQKLLDSPEVSTLLSTADPSKLPKLSLGSDGTLTAQSADGRTTTLQLSPDTAATARDLAALNATSTGTSATTRLDTSLVKAAA